MCLRACCCACCAINRPTTTQATPLFGELLARALQLVRDCACPYAKGCPACVQHLHCGNYNAVLSKAGAALVLQAALDAANEARSSSGPG